VASPFALLWEHYFGAKTREQRAATRSGNPAPPPPAAVAPPSSGPSTAKTAKGKRRAG